MRDGEEGKKRCDNEGREMDGEKRNEKREEGNKEWRNERKEEGEEEGWRVETKGKKMEGFGEER